MNNFYLNVIINYLEYMRSTIEMDTCFEIDSKQSKELYEAIKNLLNDYSERSYNLKQLEDENSFLKNIIKNTDLYKNIK